MEISDYNVTALTHDELVNIDGGIVIALLVCCFAAGLAAGLMIGI